MMRFNEVGRSEVFWNDELIILTVNISKNTKIK